MGTQLAPNVPADVVVYLMKSFADRPLRTLEDLHKHEGRMEVIDTLNNLLRSQSGLTVITEHVLRQLPKTTPAGNPGTASSRTRP